MRSVNLGFSKLYASDSAQCWPHKVFKIIVEGKNKPALQTLVMRFSSSGFFLLVLTTKRILTYPPSTPSLLGALSVTTGSLIQRRVRLRAV